jgi:hypothetical protein
MQVAAAEFAGDPELVDEFFDQRYRLKAHVPQHAGALLADHGFERVLVGALSGSHVAAVAAGCAPADALCLQHRHTVAALSQMNGGGQAV